MQSIYAAEDFPDFTVCFDKPDSQNNDSSVFKRFRVNQTPYILVKTKKNMDFFAYTEKEIFTATAKLKFTKKLKRFLEIVSR